MKNIRKYLTIGLTALAVGAGAFAVQAAEGDAASKPKTAETRAKHREHMKDRMERRAKALHDKLNLTAEQEGAWTKFAEAMTPPAPPANADRAKMAGMTAPERMDAMLAHMKEAEAHMSARAAAVKEFYAVLTPEQQKTFDKNFAKMHRPHRGGHGSKRPPAEAKPS
jgi:protein CpxP